MLVLYFTVTSQLNPSTLINDGDDGSTASAAEAANMLPMARYFSIALNDRNVISFSFA